MYIPPPQKKINYFLFFSSPPHLSIWPAQTEDLSWRGRLSTGLGNGCLSMRHNHAKKRDWLPSRSIPQKSRSDQRESAKASDVPSETRSFLFTARECKSVRSRLTDYLLFPCENLICRCVSTIFSLFFIIYIYYAVLSFPPLFYFIFYFILLLSFVQVEWFLIIDLFF